MGGSGEWAGGTHMFPEEDPSESPVCVEVPFGYDNAKFHCFCIRNGIEIIFG